MSTTTPTPATSPAMAPVGARMAPTPPRRAALIAGVGYVALFALGIFANFFVREGLIVSGDAQATAANIAGSEGLFRVGLLSFIVIFLLDVAVAWALYIVFRTTNSDVSLLTAWFRLIYTAFLGVAIIFLFQALQLLDRPDFLTVFDDAQLNAQALVALDTFNSTWLIGLVAFGIHLILLGYLAIRSRQVPRALGYVLAAAGTAYVLDTVAHALLSDYGRYETLLIAVVAVPSIIGEGWFGLWLLLRGGRQHDSHAVAHPPARA